MMIVRLMGGLGNQMFQYALYRALWAHGKEAAVDTSWFTYPSVSTCAWAIINMSHCSMVFAMHSTMRGRLHA